MPRDAAAVLAALVGAADHDILDLVGGKATLRDDPGDDLGEHVVGPHPGKRAGMASKGAAQTGIEIGLEHGSTPAIPRTPESGPAVMRARVSLSSAGNSTRAALRKPGRAR